MSHNALTSESVAPRHVDDGDLLRFEDSELDGDEHALVVSHLATCARCSDRRAELLATAARLHMANEGVVLPAALAMPPWRHASEKSRLRIVRDPARRTAPLPQRALGTATRAAAALILFAVGAAASTPVRGWIAEQYRRLGASAPVARPAPASPGSDAAANLSLRHAAALAFVPTSEVLRIGLDARTGDSIGVRATASDEVQVRARTTGGEPTLIAMPDRIRLVSAREGVTVYDVDVPPNVMVVEVHDQSRVMIRLTRATLETRGGWRDVVP
jgi:hypothetical protein